MIVKFPDKPCTRPKSVKCELLYNYYITKDIFRLVFVWQEAGASLMAPKAGQFFMIKPERSSVFLGRPISLANWQPKSEDREFIRKKARGKSTPYQRYLTGKFLESDTVTFLIAKRGKGTLELAEMKSGEYAELTGPLGNSWIDFLPSKKDKPIAVIGGGIGIAPLNALLCESPGHIFHFYAGFKNALKFEERNSLLEPSLLGAEKRIIVAEKCKDKDGPRGKIPDFLDPQNYSAVCACGPEPMLKIVAQKCKAAGVPCFVSMERRMACGVGAWLGCTVNTAKGNRRCCADGPIFRAEDVFFEGTV